MYYGRAHGIYQSLFLSTQTNAALDQTNSTLLSTRERLANLSLRLDRLESQLAQNLAALTVARGLTEEAENASAAVDLVSYLSTSNSLTAKLHA